MKKSWFFVPLACLLAACTPATGGTSASTSVSPTTASATSTAASPATPTPVPTTAGAAQLVASVAPAEGGGAAGSYGYTVTLTNRGGETATIMAPVIASLRDATGHNRSNTVTLDFTRGMPTATVAPGSSVSATLIVTNAQNVADCNPRVASSLALESASGTYSASLDGLNVYGCWGGIGDLLSAPAQ